MTTETHDAYTEMYDMAIKAGWPPELAEREGRVAVELEKVMAANPTLNPLTAHILASDNYSANVGRERLAKGEITPGQALTFAGSYSRWPLFVELWRAGHFTDEWFYGRMCETWRGADPDDTDPDTLALWKQARDWNGEYLRDGKALPRAKVLPIFRGGTTITEAANGCAWSLDVKVATSFAHGAGLRVPIATGHVIHGTIERSKVLAYITGRHELEVIVDPKEVGS